MSEYQSNTTTTQSQANTGIAPTQESPAQQVKDTYNSSHSGEFGQANRENFTGGQQTQGFNQAPQATNVQDNVQNNRENFTGSQQTQGFNQAPQATNVQNNVQDNVQDNRETLTGGLNGGQQARSIDQTPQATNVQSSRDNLSGGQQARGIDQTPQATNVQDTIQNNQDNFSGGQQARGIDQTPQATNVQNNQDNLSGGQQALVANQTPTDGINQTPQATNVEGNVQNNGQTMSERPDANQQQSSVKIQEDEKPQRNTGNENSEHEGGEKHAQPKNTGGTRDHIKEQPDTGELGGLTGKQPVGKIDVRHL
jgi:hypothetical protein